VLGPSAGSNNNTVTATSSGLTGSPVTFTASATDDSGAPQAATVNDALKLAQEADLDLKPSHRNPLVQLQADLAIALGLDRKEQGHAVDEQRGRDEGAQPLTPSVHVLSAQQQDRGGSGGDDDEQPGDRLQTMRGRHERTLLGQDGTMLLVASGGARR
jgi:hypothetical protein